MLVNEKSSRTKEPSERQRRQWELLFGHIGRDATPLNDHCSATTIWTENSCVVKWGQHGSACNLTPTRAPTCHAGGQRGAVGWIERPRASRRHVASTVDFPAKDRDSPPR